MSAGDQPFKALEIWRWKITYIVLADFLLQKQMLEFYWLKLSASKKDKIVGCQSYFPHQVPQL